MLVLADVPTHAADGSDAGSLAAAQLSALQQQQQQRTADAPRHAAAPTEDAATSSSVVAPTQPTTNAANLSDASENGDALVDYNILVIITYWLS